MMRNFHKLCGGVNVLPLVHAITRQSELWDQNDIRTNHPGTAHSQVNDILVRFNKISINESDKSRIIDDKEVIDFPPMRVLPQVRPIIFDLMRLVEGERLGRVIITRLAPGRKITPHVDMGAPATYYERYQIALHSLPGVIFRAGSEYANMVTGDVWWFDNTKEHEVINNSADDQLALIVDIRTMGGPC